MPQSFVFLTAKISMVTLIESSTVSPPPGTTADLSLPLTFFDMIWLHFHPIRRLLFYEIPCSEPYFLDTLLPKLKHSLSLTLKYYSPLAGNLVFPLDSDERPAICYAVPDSVPFAAFESPADFDDLVGNHPRDADLFYDYIPQLPPVSSEPNRKLLQVLAVQVTLFPGRGICIGVANHHTAGDATSIVGFLRAWASISKLGGEDEHITLPVSDRSPRDDIRELDSLYWEDTKGIPLEVKPFPVPTKRVRATYVLNPSQIKSLKDSVTAKLSGFAPPSSFAVASALVWTCLVKAKSVEEGEIHESDDDDDEYFLFAVDGRARIDPPLPENYFGNCLWYGLVKLQRQELVGHDGFFVAVKAIAEQIKNKVNDKEKFLKGTENGMAQLGSLWKKRIFSVSGSARVDLYGADFGWGRARKIETLSIDGDKWAMSVCKSRDCEGGLEIGLSLPKKNMDAFAALFARGLDHA